MDSVTSTMYCPTSNARRSCAATLRLRAFRANKSTVRQRRPSCQTGVCEKFARALRRRWQEVYLVSRGQRDHLFRFLFFHRMDRRKQIVEPSCGRNPEEAFHRLIRLVEDAMRNIHRHSDEIARLRDHVLAIEEQIEAPLEEINELVLSWMDMRRDKRPWRKCRMPGKRALAQRFRNVSLPENIPDNAFDAGTGLGDACGQRLHSVPPFMFLMPLRGFG